jgi:hypothetical protein
MSSKQISYKHKCDRDRATRFKNELLAARRELAAAKKQLDERYAEGSAATLGFIFAAVNYDLRIQNWLTDKIGRIAGRKAPPLPPHILDAVLDDIRRSGITEIRLEDL